MHERIDARPSWDETFMNMALVIAKRATCPRARKVCLEGIGAVLVERATHLSLGFGYCGSRPGAAHCDDVGCDIGPAGGCIRTTHAEINAIRHARQSDVEKTMYSTVSPCEACMLALIHARVTRAVYLHEYRIIEPVRAIAKQAGVELIGMSMRSA